MREALACRTWRTKRFASRFALHGGPKFSPDGRYVYFASRDGWISKYDLWNLRLVAEVRAGATLLYDSDPDEEERETRIKAAAFIDAIRRPRGAPVEKHAVDFLAEAILDSGRQVTLVAVGPLTNVALLLARHPAAAGSLERIVLMGGAIAEGNVTPAAEFNVWADPEAAWRVFHCGLPVTMIGLDVTHQALMTAEHAVQLREAGPAGRLVADLYDFFVGFHRETYGFDGAPIHDAVAVAHVLRPGLVETLPRHVDVDCESRLCRGRTVVDLWRRTGEEPNADVGVGIDAEGFLALLCERIASL